MTCVLNGGFQSLQVCTEPAQPKLLRQSFISLIMTTFMSQGPLIQRSVHCFWFLYQSLVPNIMKSMFKKRKMSSCFPAVGTCLVQSWLDSGRTAGLDENLIEFQPAAKTFLAVHLKCFRPNFLFPFVSVNSCNNFLMSRIRQKSKSDI